jgi:hypothetical protein
MSSPALDGIPKVSDNFTFIRSNIWTKLRI